MVSNLVSRFLLHTPEGLALLNLGVFIFLILVIRNIIIPYFRRVAKRTKSDLDDILLDIISRPLVALVVLIGLYTSSEILSSKLTFLINLDKFFFVVGVLVASWMVAEIFVFFATFWFEKEKKVKLPGVISKVIYLFVFTIGFLTILDYFNIALSPLIATLGVGSLAVGLALQSTLSDFFAGLHIMSDKPIRVGDFVELEDGTIGYVDDVGWRSTRIRALGDYTIIIPNSKLSQSKIINYAMPVKPTNVIVNCGVAYDSDLERVERIVKEVARKTQEKLADMCETSWEPLVRYNNFGDSNIEFAIILRAKDYAYRYTIMHEFIKDLKKRFDEEGIEISWPVRKLYFGNSMPPANEGTSQPKNEKKRTRRKKK